MQKDSPISRLSFLFIGTNCVPFYMEIAGKKDINKYSYSDWCVETEQEDYLYNQGKGIPHLKKS